MFNKNPVHMERSKYYGNDYYICHSHKLNRRVCLYSKLEYGNFLDVELNPSITEYLEQPLQVNVRDDEENICKTIFDMEVVFEDGEKELWEIKYSKDLTGVDKSAVRAQKQIKNQRKWCLDNNVIYKVRTENDIFKGIEHFNNMRFMYHCISRVSFDYLSKSIERINRKIESENFITIEELYKYVPDPSSVYPAIIYLLIHEYITADIYNQELSFSTEVRYVK